MHQGRFAEAEPFLVTGHEAISRERSLVNFLVTDSLARMVRLYEGLKQPERARPYRKELAESCVTISFINPWPISQLAFGPELLELRAAMKRVQEQCGITYGAAEGSARGTSALIGDLKELFDHRRRSLDVTATEAAVVARLLLRWADALDPKSGGGARALIADEAAAILEAWKTRLPLDLAEALALQSRAALDSGNDARAVDLARRSSTLVSGVFEQDSWLTAVSKARVARCLIAQKLFEEAEGLLRPVYEVLQEQLGPSSTETQEVRRLLVRLYESWGRPDAAVPFKTP